MWTYSNCEAHTDCEGCRLKACCPVVLDLRLHTIEQARQEETTGEGEWLAHGTILDLTSGSARLQQDPRR